MKTPDIRSLILLTFFALTPCLLSAKIPEPSNVLFGTVHISGKQILKTDSEVTVVARLANTEIASYQMGSNAAYGDQYLLKIPLDSVGNRNTHSTQKNDTINIFVSNILANTVTVGERGTVTESNLAVDATDTD
ncbi:MAG: hypothetical protein MJE63_26590, partial [Proteobacteria bacterium]|nr:hypothetical protein [Pseudomonadota bacterium]